MRAGPVGFHKEIGRVETETQRRDQGPRDVRMLGYGAVMPNFFAVPPRGASAGASQWVLGTAPLNIRHFRPNPVRRQSIHLDWGAAAISPQSLSREPGRCTVGYSAESTVSAAHPAAHYEVSP